MTKILYSIAVVIVMTSCSSSFIGRRYTFVNHNPNPDWEIELRFYSDSSFTIKDKYGCTQMDQKGKWRLSNANDSSIFLAMLILTDTTKPQIFKDWNGNIFYKYKSNDNGKLYINSEAFYFPLVSTDTVCVLEKNKILFRGNTFDVYSGNLQKKRIRLIEREDIEKLGKRLYLKVSHSSNIKQARKKMLECQQTE